MNPIEELQQIIDTHNRIVFFTGAGVSTESGIPDFRSQDGLYNQTYRYPPEEIVSHTFLTKYPEEFFAFYKDRMIYLDAKPSIAHTFIAKMEQEQKCIGVVTQNIDGLHQLAGSKHVAELHGSTLRNYCTRCRTTYSAKWIKAQPGIPHCEKCGDMVRPDVVLYEEGLDGNVLNTAVHWIQQADCLIVMGTSLLVYPAAGLIRYFQGDKLVLINKSTTPYDENADLVVQDTFAHVLKQLTY